MVNMDSNPRQQILQQLKKAGSIAIVLPEQISADALASGLALKLFLAKQQKEVFLVSSGQVPGNLNFLPGVKNIQSSISGESGLVIVVDTSLKKLEELSYQKQDQQVSIFLKSDGEEFSERDVSFVRKQVPLDLIIAIGGRSLEDFGKMFAQEAGRFFEVPKINLDNRPDNEYFGTINLVDITASSISEMLTELFQEYEQQLLDEDIATCLLAGIIEKTSSFQHAQTTPKAFVKASELVALGGRQQEVVKNLFKTKSLGMLKLWGRALARLKILPAQNAVYTVLNQGDFEKSENGGAKEVLPVLRELVDGLGNHKIIGLVAEPAKDQTVLVLALHVQVPARNFLETFQGARLLSFNFGSFSLLELTDSKLSIQQLESRLLGAVGSLPDGVF